MCIDVGMRDERVKGRECVRDGDLLCFGEVFVEWGKGRWGV